MDNPTSLGSDAISAVGRTFAVLEALGEREGDCGVSELAQSLKLSKSTAHRFLQTLKALGYVVQDAEDRYRLGVKLFELGARALPQLDLIREAEPGMRQLNDLTGETVHLGIFDEKSIVYLHKIDSRYNLRMYSKIGRRAPLYCTGIGKILMAWRPEEEIRQIMGDEKFVRRTPNTISDMDLYLSELSEIRLAGYAEDREEFEDNIRCIAAPIRDRFGRVVAGLSVSFPCFRFREEMKAMYVSEMIKVTSKVSKNLGG
ncbi:DNA-binding transcriptional regulator KdgR [Pseudomonas benzopyrenica]|uniref:DNA-binding transcriptional regulator KdgR n=1 Tax=Pseudomonas benzopyrenica TaxID=2993566 RepID=UPI0039C21A2A